MITDVNILHVKGESKFIDDLVLPENTLYASVVTSTIAKGKIIDIDFSDAKQVDGVITILTAKDIPGENQIGNIFKDEPLFAEDEVHFIGQPILLILAETKASAQKAKKLVDVFYEEEQGIFDARTAYTNNEIIGFPKTFEIGNVDNCWDECDIILSDTVKSGGQEHLYLETQGTISIPLEGGNIKVLSSTQSPSLIQKTIADVLNISMHNIEVEVLRLGGGFGGKEDQATPWAVMTAIGAQLTNRPVKLVLSRSEDIPLTGKRHPYISDYKIGLNSDGSILAYEVNFFQNAGAAADLSPAILERTLFHTTNSYYIPNVRATAVSCRTNLPPNTAFRGFGGPQAMFVIESAIHKAAEHLDISVADIQFRNLFSKDDILPYGMKVKDNHARICWDMAIEEYNYHIIKNEINKFNDENYYFKKGFSLMPVCFGISFTSTFLNQASALVHIYTDGSIGISSGAVEMGQGVNKKLKSIVSNVFSVPQSIIKIESTNTSRIANSSPTAASSAADMNGNAVKIACEKIKKRLLDQASKLLERASTDEIKFKDENVWFNDVRTNLTWQKLIESAYFERISLSEQAHYATPNIFFDKTKCKGDAFAYHVVGTAITSVTVDCLRGIYIIDNVKIVHGSGKSLNEKIDLGQIEGGLTQGIGWMTIEEILHNSKGKLITDTLSTYKVPDIYSAPAEIKTIFYDNPENSAGPYGSKAVGEPPLMYGIGTYFAIINAMKSFKPDLKIQYDAPLTHEKVLMMLYED